MLTKTCEGLPSQGIWTTQRTEHVGACDMTVERYTVMKVKQIAGMAKRRFCVYDVSNSSNCVYAMVLSAMSTASSATAMNQVV